MGVVAEGFQDPLREHHLGSVLAKLAQAAQKATDAPTRECLCFAYGQLAEHCQPEIIGHSNAVIPVVFEFLNDQRAAVVGAACYVLGTLFARAWTRDQVAATSSSWRRRSCVAGRASVGPPLAGDPGDGGRGRRFGSGRGVRQIRPLLGGHGAATRGHGRARGRTGLGAAWRSLEALGHVALAVGNAKFAPYRDTALRAAAANLELDSTELAEYSYGFFANCAKVMRSDFGPFAATSPASTGCGREKGRGLVRFRGGRRRGRRRVQCGLLR